MHDHTRPRLPSLLLLCLAGPLSAQVYWVDGNNGSNANNGTSPTSAWRTISHAITQLPRGAGVFPTLNVLDATYPENVVVDRAVRIEALPRARMLPLNVPGSAAFVVSNAGATYPIDVTVKNFDIVTEYLTHAVKIDAAPDLPPVQYVLLDNNSMQQAALLPAAAADVVTADYRTAGAFTNFLHLKLNTINGPASAELAPDAGVRVVASGAGLATSVALEANRVLRCVRGLAVEGVATDVESTVFGHCTLGIDVLGAVLAVNQTTIADPRLPGAAPLGGIRNVYVAGANVRNSIVWIPDIGGIPGDDLMLPAGSAVLYSISEDAGDCALYGSTNLCSNTIPSPGLSATLDLLPGSPAIDSGDAGMWTSSLWYTGIDVHGEPRFVDSGLSGTAVNDRGADESTYAWLDATLLTGLAVRSSRTMLDGRVGDTLQLSVTGPAGALAAIYLSGRHDGWAVIGQPGALLIDPNATLIGTWTLPMAQPLAIPVSGAQETELEFQALVAPSTLGTLTNAVIFEVNK